LGRTIRAYPWSESAHGATPQGGHCPRPLASTSVARVLLLLGWRNAPQKKAEKRKKSAPAEAEGEAEDGYARPSFIWALRAAPWVVRPPRCSLAI
jgi:hypothetical protein